MEVVSFGTLVCPGEVYSLLQLFPTHTLCCARVEEQLKCIGDYMKAVAPCKLSEDRRFAAEAIIQILILNTALCARRIHFARLYGRSVPCCRGERHSVDIRAWSERLLEPFQEWRRFSDKLLTGVAQAMRLFHCPRPAFEQLLRHPKLQELGRCRKAKCGCFRKGDAAVTMSVLVDEALKIRQAFQSPNTNWNHLFFRPARSCRLNKCRTSTRNHRACDYCAYRGAVVRVGRPKTTRTSERKEEKK